MSTGDKNLMIRPAKESDAEVLGELGARTFSEAYSDILPVGDLEDYLGEAFSVGQMLEDIADPEVLLFVASISGTPCAYMKLQPTPVRRCICGANPIELLRLYIDSPFKGRGIGTALMDAGLGTARRKAYRTCWLKVWEGNTEAIAFYENKGFSRVGNEPYPVASTCRNVVLMARPLEQ